MSRRKIPVFWFADGTVVPFFIGYVAHPRLACWLVRAYIARYRAEKELTEFIIRLVFRRNLRRRPARTRDPTQIVRYPSWPAAVRLNYQFRPGTWRRLRSPGLITLPR